MNKTAVIITGGTGGHVLPSIYFGNYLINNGYNCNLITDKRGKKFTKNFVGNIEIINASHLTGNIVFQLIGIFKLIIGCVESFILLLKLKPQVVISFGSYASLPPCLAVILLKKFFKINFFIHEQNSIIGKSNKFFLKKTDKFFVNFDKDYSLGNKVKKKISVVGLPYSQQNKQNDNLNLFKKINNKFVFFLYGGSQGSIPLLKCLIKIIDNFNSNELKKIFFIIQCPNSFREELINKIYKYNINFEIKDFYFNLPKFFEKTDLILSRSRAGTTNDLISYQIPFILVPLPSSKDNHQYENAIFLLKKNNNGIILDQNNFDVNKALIFIKQLLEDKIKRKNIKEKIKRKNIPDANKLMLEIIKNEISK